VLIDEVLPEIAHALLDAERWFLDPAWEWRDQLWKYRPAVTAAGLISLNQALQDMRKVGLPPQTERDALVIERINRMRNAACHINSGLNKVRRNSFRCNTETDVHDTTIAYGDLRLTLRGDLLAAIDAAWVRLGPRAGFHASCRPRRPAVGDVLVATARTAPPPKKDHDL
jgi:hypothetical protein